MPFDWPVSVRLCGAWLPCATLSGRGFSTPPPSKEEAISLYDKTVYPRLSRAIAADEVRLRFTPTAEEIDFGDQGSRSPGSRLTLLTLLKLFQYLHRFPDPNEVPPAVVQHLASNSASAMRFRLTRATLSSGPDNLGPSASTPEFEHGAKRPVASRSRLATMPRW